MPVDPYELLDSTFTDIADAIRYYEESHPPTPVEEVTTVTSDLQTILENKTGARAASTGGLLTRLKGKTHKCLMTVVEDVSTYALRLVLIESVDDSVDISETDVSIVQTETIPSDVTITVNVQKSVCVRVYGVNNRDQWNNESETATTIGYQETKTFSSNYISLVGSGSSFANTKTVQPSTNICPLDFAKRVSSTITERSKPSLNAIFTDVANAIRYEQGFPDIDPEDIKPGHILAPNGKYYGYYYYYKLTDTRYGWINMDLKIWSDYRIAGTKTYTFQLMNPTNNAFMNLSSGYVGSYEDENYYWTQEHDYVVYDGRWNNSSPMGPNYYSEPYYSVETNMPLFDTQTDEQNFLKISLISVPDMPTLIRNL